MENDLKLLLSPNHWDYILSSVCAVLESPSRASCMLSKSTTYQLSHAPSPHSLAASSVVCEAGRHSLALLQKGTVKAKYGHMQKVPGFQQTLGT